MAGTEEANSSRRETGGSRESWEGLLVTVRLHRRVAWGVRKFLESSRLDRNVEGEEPRTGEFWSPVRWGGHQLASGW